MKGWQGVRDLRLYEHEPSGGTPIERVLEALEDAGCQPQPVDKGYVALCPAHDDHNPSLAIGVGDDGRVLLKCRAGCDTQDILDALGLDWSDLFDHEGDSGMRTDPKRERQPPNNDDAHDGDDKGEHWELVETYKYLDAAGQRVLQHAALR